MASKWDYHFNFIHQLDVFCRGERNRAPLVQNKMTSRKTRILQNLESRFFSPTLVQSSPTDPSADWRLHSGVKSTSLQTLKERQLIPFKLLDSRSSYFTFLSRVSIAFPGSPQEVGGIRVLVPFTTQVLNQIKQILGQFTHYYGKYVLGFQKCTVTLIVRKNINISFRQTLNKTRREYEVGSRKLLIAEVGKHFSSKGHLAINSIIQEQMGFVSGACISNLLFTQIQTT